MQVQKAKKIQEISRNKYTHNNAFLMMRKQICGEDTECIRNLDLTEVKVGKLLFPSHF